MKKIILVAVVSLSSLATNAQVWVGGSLGFNTTNYKNGHSTTKITIAPTVGYKLSPKWEIALSVEETAVFADDNTNAFSIAPFARFNFYKAGIVTLFVDGGFSVGTQNYNSNYSKTESQTNWGLGFRPGLKIEVSDNMSLEAKTGYLGLRNVVDSYTNFGFGVNNESLSIGLAYEF